MDIMEQICQKKSGMIMDRICDVVIVGTGAAGLFCALNFPDQVNFRMIT